MSKPRVRKDEKSGLYYRPDSIDDYIIREARGYDLLGIQEEDRVLDVGGCIGSFAARAAATGARVVSYEPDPENFKLLEINSPHSENVNAALTSQHIDYVTLYKNTGKNKALHSTTPHRGREFIQVPAVRMSYAMTSLDPTVMKMDCEGAEYDLLDDFKFGTIDRMAIEWHLTKPEWRGKAPRFHEQVIASGFKMIKGNVAAFSGKTWATVIFYKRN